MQKFSLLLVRSLLWDGFDVIDHLYEHQKAPQFDVISKRHSVLRIGSVARENVSHYVWCVFIFGGSNDYIVAAKWKNTNWNHVHFGRYFGIGFVNRYGNISCWYIFFCEMRNLSILDISLKYTVFVWMGHTFWTWMLGAWCISNSTFDLCLLVHCTFTSHSRFLFVLLRSCPRSKASNSHIYLWIDHSLCSFAGCFFTFEYYLYDYWKPLANRCTNNSIQFTLRCYWSVNAFNLLDIHFFVLLAKFRKIWLNVAITSSKSADGFVENLCIKNTLGSGKIIKVSI